MRRGGESINRGEGEEKERTRRGEGEEQGRGGERSISTLFILLLQEGFDIFAIIFLVLFAGTYLPTHPFFPSLSYLSYFCFNLFFIILFLLLLIQHVFLFTLIYFYSFLFTFLIVGIVVLLMALVACGVFRKRRNNYEEVETEERDGRSPSSYPRR